MRYQAPRGTQDILPPEQPHWRYVADTAQALAHRFGYGRIDTPAFEQAGLFVRSVGQGTDIVEKEMYTFLDRGGAELTLRPEGTATRLQDLPGARHAHLAPARAPLLLLPCLPL